MKLKTSLLEDVEFKSPGLRLKKVCDTHRVGYSKGHSFVLRLLVIARQQRALLGSLMSTYTSIFISGHSVHLSIVDDLALINTNVCKHVDTCINYIRVDPPKNVPGGRRGGGE